MISTFDHLRAFRRHPAIYLRGRIRGMFLGVPKVRHNILHDKEPVAGRLDGYLDGRQKSLLADLLAYNQLGQVFLPPLEKTERAYHVMNSYFAWEEISDILLAVRAKSPRLLRVVFAFHGITFPYCRFQVPDSAANDFFTSEVRQ